MQTTCKFDEKKPRKASKRSIGLNTLKIVHPLVITKNKLIEKKVQKNKNDSQPFSI